MGLYSRNRISSISAEAVEAKLEAAKVQEAADVTEPENVEVPTETVSESTYFDNIEVSEGYTGLVDTNIQILENEHNMFNSLIELDFITSMNESMLNIDESAEAASNSHKVEKIEENINKIFTATKETMMQAGKKLVVAAESINAADSKIFEKYIPAINEANSLDGFDGIEEFAITNAESAEAIDRVINMESANEIFDEFVESLKEAESVDDITECFDTYSLSLENCVAAVNSDASAAMEVSKSWAPTKEDKIALTNFADKKYVTNAMAESVSSIVDEVASLNTKVSEIIESTDNTQEINVAKANCIYKAISEYCKLANKKMAVYCNLEAREIAGYRKAIMCCGRYASKNLKGIQEASEVQSMMNYVIGESSNAYVFEKMNK